MRSTLLAALLLGVFAGVLAAQDVGAPLEIVDRPLPKAILSANYEAKLAAHGGLPPWTWAIIAGHLPDGLTLNPATGTVSGAPTELGQFRFAVEVSDSDDPPDARTREFTITVISALTLEWKATPALTTDGIAGSVRVSNQTADDVDLTLIIVAVNEVGKAFVLGYQQFVLAAQDTVQEIPFGASLPQGNYIVHADLIGEVPNKNAIYRERLQTSEPLVTPSQ